MRKRGGRTLQLLARGEGGGYKNREMKGMDEEGEEAREERQQQQEQGYIFVAETSVFPHPLLCTIGRIANLVPA